MHGSNISDCAMLARSGHGSSCTAQSLDPVFFLSLVLRSLDTHKNNISDCAIVA
jgi:hypothetical protein